LALSALEIRGDLKVPGGVFIKLALLFCPRTGGWSFDQTKGNRRRLAFHKGFSGAFIGEDGS